MRTNLTLMGAERATPSSVTILLEGAADLRGASALREQLVEALATGSPVCVDTRGATSCDAGIVQILMAACRSAERSGRDLSIIAESGGALPAALDRLGVSTAFG
jgi:anti-anti-sigma regulatory factor